MSSSKKHARLVKFIVHGDKVIFGKGHYMFEGHGLIAYNNGLIDIAEQGGLSGGGVADMKEKRIYGMSYDFGPYDRAKVQRLLGPTWTVETPGKY